MSRLKIRGTEVAISRIGFGCARVYGGHETKASARLIEAALTAGIRHFDTAPSYGFGESESVLGELLAGLPDVTIGTKIGLPRPDSAIAKRPLGIAYRRMLRPVLSHFPSLKSRLLQVVNRSSTNEVSAVVRRKLSDDEVLRGLEDSMKRLKRSFVDLYLLHEPDQFALTDELLELFHKLQHDRVIGAFGLAYGRVANASPEFGTIIQSQHTDTLPELSDRGHTRIFHGVLRHSWHEARRRKGDRSPTEYLEKVLGTNRDAAVIFSASSPGQIRGLVGDLLV